METGTVLAKARSGARATWGIGQFAAMVLAAFAPVYVGILVGILLPVGGLRWQSGVLTAILIATLPVAWFVVSAPAVTVAQAATKVVLRRSPRASDFGAELVEAVMGYVILVLVSMIVFDNLARAALCGLVAVVLYELLAPAIERRCRSTT